MVVHTTDFFTVWASRACPLKLISISTLIDSLGWQSMWTFQCKQDSQGDTGHLCHNLLRYDSRHLIFKQQQKSTAYYYLSDGVCFHLSCGYLGTRLTFLCYKDTKAGALTYWSCCKAKNKHLKVRMSTYLLNWMKINLAHLIHQSGIQLLILIKITISNNQIQYTEYGVGYLVGNENLGTEAFTQELKKKFRWILWVFPTLRNCELAKIIASMSTVTSHVLYNSRYRIDVQ